MCCFEENCFYLIHGLMLRNVFLKMTHVLPMISAQNCDKNAIHNRQHSAVTVVSAIIAATE